jgi:hypothetical protein
MVAGIKRALVANAFLPSTVRGYTERLPVACDEVLPG